ncbi:MAG: AAA family ATPase [Deltaproteobacteria bacterium]|nr:AAA family ATPase [Deltaproteobacteria bacterium]
MSKRFHHLRVTNFRSLASLDLELRPVNVMFGPCGAGKSSLLDVFWFVRDCLFQDTDNAGSGRDHGLGMLWDGAAPGSTVSFEFSTSELDYLIEFGFSEGRLDPFPRERLAIRGEDPITLLERRSGSQVAEFKLSDADALTSSPLRDPAKPSIDRYVDSSERPDVRLMAALLRACRSYASRSFHFEHLRRFGSESDRGTLLDPPARKLWSVLRNLKERRSRTPNYDTITSFMKRAFPDSFVDLEFEQTGPGSVYATMIEIGRNQPTSASHVSDGHLQMLAILTALFGGIDSHGLMMFDEPELSLHPWPLAVMGEAMREATTNWNKQILVATHSPVLISQFEQEDLLVVERSEGHTSVRRLSEIPEVQDLLEQFAAGSIYMAQAIAPQGGKPQFLPGGDK